MAAVKTAISIEEPLLAKVDELAERMELPRSRVLALAAEEFIRKHESQRLLEALNRAYEDEPEGESEESRVRSHWRRKHRQQAQGEW